MKIKILISKFHGKVRAEALIKAAVYGLISGFALCAVITAVSRLSGNGSVLPAAVAGGAAAALTAAYIYAVLFKPSIKRTAARVDRLGMEERVITMLELEGVDTFMANKQSENTRAKLTEVKPKNLKIAVPRALLAILAATAALSVILIRLDPVSASAPSDAREFELEDDDYDIIKYMLDDLRTVIEEAHISPSLKYKLNSVVNELEFKLRETDSTFEKLMKIFETAQEINRILAEALTQKDIAEALKNYDTTKELGEAIESSETEQIKEAFDNIREKVDSLEGQEKADELNQTADDIESALFDAGDPQDKLANALQKLADELRRAAELVEEGEDAAADEVLDEAFEAGLDEIGDALDEQAAISDALDQLQEILEESLDELAGDEFAGMFTPDDFEYDDEFIPGYLEFDGEIDIFSMESEKVIDGETPYKDVLEGFLKDATNAMVAGKFPDEVRDVIQKYYEIIK